MEKADEFCRHSADKRPGRHIFRDHGSSRDHSMFANRNALENRCASTYPDAIFDDDRCFRTGQCMVERVVEVRVHDEDIVSDGYIAADGDGCKATDTGSGIDECVVTDRNPSIFASTHFDGHVCRQDAEFISNRDAGAIPYDDLAINRRF